ncbi:Fc receptor-like protein 5 [Lates calcarifer]|uniref:Fc receptor-like protein 5 n=1 Tax=Lates calcarifer TaxID=8187 RepID=A0AAJ8BES3_LATCA|nr:Fc receptor-like protein 5 [Lates calcarifer]
MYEWRPAKLNKPPSHNEYRINRATESDSGDYRCKARSEYLLTEWSDKVRLTVSPNKPRPTLRADTSIIPVWSSVTLTCSVIRSAGWTVFKWYRRSSDSSEAQVINGGRSNHIIRISEGGIYTCRGGRGKPEFFTEESKKVTIQKTVSNTVTVTLQPNWSQIFSGETITVRCEIQGGGNTGWTYEWETPSSNNPPSRNEYRINRATVSDSGDYRCRGRKDYSFTQWSNVIRLTVSSDKPQASLRADRTVRPAGGSVTLTCSVDRSAGWTVFKWYRRSSDSSEAQVINGGRSNHIIRISEGGIYTCRGGRGKPEFFTEESNKVTIQKTVSNTVTVTLQPNWPQIYRDETITVRCKIQGGGDTEWTYEWEKNSYNKPPSRNEYRINRATESDSGDYRCRGRKDYSLTQWSNVIRLTVSSDKPQASLRADRTVIPAGGSVTLTCSVNPSPGWKYFLYRDNKLSEPLTTHDAAFQTTGRTSVSQEGLYSCRGGRGDPVYYTEYSHSVSIDITVSNRAVVILQPNWSEIYRGETITVRCEIQGGGDTEWEYHIMTSFHSEYPGASVTLNCEVEHPSAGWRFYWYKTVPDLSHNSYIYELLPGNSSGTEQDSYIVHGQTHTAGYVCRAGRGDPVFYTDNSEPKFVWSGDLHPAASLTVNPDRVQHFYSDSVSLSCEGNSAEWRVKRFNEHGYQSDCSDWRRMTGSTCNMRLYWYGNAVYWCESGSGEFSNAVNITVQSDYYYDIILVSPVHPVTEGESVSLGCRFRTEEKLSSVFFYHNDKLIQNDTRQELNISAVSKSDEGFYKCQWSGRKSAQSWMSVKVAVPEPKSSSFPVSLVVGLVCGITLIILLLLLYHYRQDLCCIRLIQSKRSSRSSTANHRVNQNETLRNQYSVVQGDVSVYDTIRDSGDAEHGDAALYDSIRDSAENGAGESMDVTYSVIELKNTGKKGKRCEPGESSVYSDVKIGATAVYYRDVASVLDNSPMYAQVTRHDKGKRKKKKAESTPAATDEAVYSQVNPGTSSGL